MKKNYTTPSLKVDFFHTESILHTSSVGPTNAGVAKESLRIYIDETRYKLLDIIDIFLN